MKRLIRCFIISFTIIFLFSGIESTVFANGLTASMSVKDHLENKNQGQLEDEPLDPENKVNKENQEQLGIDFFDIVRMLFSLILVIAILYFLLKFINKKSRSYQRNKIIQNIGGSSLGGNRSIQIVKVGNRLFVIGVGENIQLLKEIENEEEVNEMLQLYNEPPEQVEPITWLNNWLQNKKKNQPEEQSNVSFQQYLKQNLEEIKKKRLDVMEKLERKGTKDE